MLGSNNTKVFDMVQDFPYWSASLQQQYGLNVFTDYINIKYFFNCLLPNFSQDTSMGSIMRIRRGKDLTDEEKKIRKDYLLK